MCSNVSLFVKYVCCVYSLVEKWWLNVCGCGLSRTNKELLWLWQSDGQMRRLWSNHVKPDLLSAVESAFSEGQQVNVWSFVDVTPVFTKEFLQSVSNSDTHAARWKWAVCVPIQCKSCRFFSAGNSRRVIDACETLFVLVTEPHNAARRKRITQTDTAAHSGHICEGPCYSCWFSCASLCF